MESHPNNQQPASPIETGEHEHAAKNLNNPQDVDEPMSLEFGNALRCVCINVWQQAGKQCDAAEHYEYPTDDRD